MADDFGKAIQDVYSPHAAFRPPKRVSVSQGAAASLIVKQTGGTTAPWSATETPYMCEPIDTLASRRHEAVAFVGPARCGKCLDVTTPIPTPDGWRTMGDLEAGDFVFGSDGRPTMVDVAHPVLYDLKCYEVTLADGSKLVADADHLWGVERFYWKTPNWRYEVKTTEELLADLLYSPRADGRARFRYRIRNAQPLVYDPSDLPIDPYLVGVWLGNGMRGKPYTSQHEDDTDHYSRAATRAGFANRWGKDGENTTILYIGQEDGPEEIRFTTRLRELGVFENKHIPRTYLRGSVDQRWALLRGLMDTDGYPGNDDHPSVEFSTASETLSLQFCELARSLGLKPISKKKTTTWTHLGERRFGVAWRITFPVPEGASVFTLPRKVEKGRCASIDVGFRQIVAITPVETRPVRCIKVTAPDSLFLAGEGTVPTHNTEGLITGWMAHAVVNDPGDMAIIHMSQEKAREFSKTTVDRALRHSPDLAALVSRNANADNTFDKSFRHGMWLKIGWPTVSNLSGSTYRYVAFTDYDRMPDDVGGEGAPFPLGLKRTQTFLSRGMCLVESSPGRDVEDPNWKPSTPHEAPPVRGVVGIYNTSDRRRWYWKCHDCREWFEAAPGVGLFNLPPDDELLETVRSANLDKLAEHYAKIVCPHCGSLHGADQKKALNANGRWLRDGLRLTVDDELVGEGMTSSIAGFWLGGVAAAFQPWRSILVRHLQGLRHYALSGSEEALKNAINVDQGMPYISRHLKDSQSGRARPQDRAEDGLVRYQVPAETRMLKAAVDVQGGVNSRFVVQLHAVGPHMEQWLVDRFEIKLSKRPGMGQEFAPIDPASFVEDWGVLTDKLLNATWKTPDPNREIKIRMLTIDTGGEDGVTHNAYAWYRQVRKAGMAHRVTLYKGGSTPTAPIIKETMVGGRKGTKGDIPLLVCNPNLLADMVSAGLRRETPGPGFYHWPTPKHPTLNPDGWLPESFFLELEAEVRGKNGTWNQIRKRNESADLCRMCMAGMLRMGLDKIKDWNVVPPWLAPLDKNSEIVAREDRRAAQENSVIAQAPAEDVRVVRPARRPRRHSVAQY